MPASLFPSVSLWLYDDDTWVLALHFSHLCVVHCYYYYHWNIRMGVSVDSFVRWVCFFFASSVAKYTTVSVTTNMYEQKNCNNKLGMLEIVREHIIHQFMVFTFSFFICAGSLVVLCVCVRQHGTQLVRTECMWGACMVMMGDCG